MPFSNATGSLGVIATSSSELEATYYNIKSLLLTDWGERPNHMNMGCNLTEFLFEPMSSEVESAVSDRITSQIGTWLPYVNVDSISVKSSFSNQMRVSVSFSIAGRTDLTGLVEANIYQSGG